MADGTPQDPRYPASKPFHESRLPVPGGHEIWYAQYGNPAGKPALFVHGGPGGGCTGDDHRFFDPDAWRIVLFDQRGAGRSTPHAETRENTTSRLVEDIELLRELLEIPEWLLFGGSWGSTLALAYAEAHPARVSALVLRGIFLVRQREFDWYYRDGTPLVFPEAAKRFHGLLSEDERADPIAAYHARVNSDDEETRRAALEEWARWEGETSSLRPDPARVEAYTDADFAAAFAGIELHYFANRGFFDHDGQLLTEADRIADIPGVIVHGRYDMVCPVENAVELHRRWPRSDLKIVPNAGHDADEPGIRRELIAATDRFRG